MDELEALLKDLFCGDDERAEAAANALAQFGKQAVDALASVCAPMCRFSTQPATRFERSR